MNTPKNLEELRPNDEGFTLIELLIVMSIMLILMMLAVPQLLKLRKQGNETSAVASLRAINQAEMQYNSQYPANGFSCGLGSLGGSTGTPPTPAAAQVLQANLATGAKDGYLFAITNCTKVTVNNQDMITGFEITAIPASVGRSGDRGYCMDENGVIKYDPAGATNCTANQ